MTNKEKDIIENVASKARFLSVQGGIILKDTTSLSIDVLCQIVEYFGGNLDYDSTTVYLEKTDNKRFTIHCSEDSSSLDILHELGHAFFDLASIENSEKMFCDGVEKKDLRASFFARSYIMPQDKFEEVVIRCSVKGNCDIQKVAEIYDVDYFSVLMRGEELNIWR